MKNFIKTYTNIINECNSTKKQIDELFNRIKQFNNQSIIIESIAEKKCYKKLVDYINDIPNNKIVTFNSKLLQNLLVDDGSERISNIKKSNVNFAVNVIKFNFSNKSEIETYFNRIVKKLDGDLSDIPTYVNKFFNDYSNTNGLTIPINGEEYDVLFNTHHLDLDNIVHEFTHIFQKEYDIDIQQSVVFSTQDILKLKTAGINDIDNIEYLFDSVEFIPHSEEFCYNLIDLFNISYKNKISFGDFLIYVLDTKKRLNENIENTFFDQFVQSYLTMYSDNQAPLLTFIISCLTNKHFDYFQKHILDLKNV